MNLPYFRCICTCSHLRWRLINPRESICSNCSWWLRRLACPSASLCAEGWVPQTCCQRHAGTEQAFLHLCRARVASMLRFSFFFLSPKCCVYSQTSDLGRSGVCASQMGGRQLLSGKQILMENGSGQLLAPVGKSNRLFEGAGKRLLESTPARHSIKAQYLPHSAEAFGLFQ